MATTSQAPRSSVAEALETVEAESRTETDGTWLETAVERAAPHIAEWDVKECWLWQDWPGRANHDYSRQDIGIDVVAIRAGDGARIAIQCKARKLDDTGSGSQITKKEVDSFASASSGKLWSERWLVTNGNNPLSSNAMASVPVENPIKLVNFESDLRKHQQSVPSGEQECRHCEMPDDPDARQTRSCMQAEAVRKSLEVLRAHEGSDSGGLPRGEARGKIVLPCGTGKTRIALRIVEKLSEPGQLAIVLCPSIALVAQIRREFLACTETGLRTLAVCSDQTAGFDRKAKSEGLREDDPTADLSRVSASEVKGLVTTDADRIAEWMREGTGNRDRIGVIFGTYQSSHRIGEALCKSGITAEVLIADEAHRTAGLRRIRKIEAQLRDFTVCHDNQRFPVRYRVYQTATPRVYDTRRRRTRNDDWVVRDMDDETVFGVELYRKSYMEAVRNGWLTDYRIIALGVNDPAAYEAANQLAKTGSGRSGRNALTTTHFLRGLTLALVLGGATRTEDGAEIRSCIGFMNTVAKSKEMAKQLESDMVRKWVQDWLDTNRAGQAAAGYALEHLDASSNVMARENAKSRLAAANQERPHGILNVGIFGEGTDAPSLSAVAFLEARKSPIDVIQAVGRAMRLSEGKSMGYIICPILIPPSVDAEQWLETSGPTDGWQELGQVLLALRAHDSRIEEQLSKLLKIYLPAPAESESTLVAIGSVGRVSYHAHYGTVGSVEDDVTTALQDPGKIPELFRPVEALRTAAEDLAGGAREGVGAEPYGTTGTETGSDVCANSELPKCEGGGELPPFPPPASIVTGHANPDGDVELRVASPERGTASADGTPGPVDIAESKKKARAMLNGTKGQPLQPRKKRTPEEVNEARAGQMLDLSLAEGGLRITANLLSKSGLRHDRVARDLNLLEASVSEAARHLRDDELGKRLDRHFGLDHLDPKKTDSRADGCTVGALLMMNAAMLHQRIASGRWVSGVKGLDEIKSQPQVVRQVERQWNRISQRDFLPILQPAIKVIEAVEDTGKLAGLERALRHICAEAERIAETYADMGADHAGPLFNRVMGDQASDGAYFTRPVAASITARLALDACGEADWGDEAVWRAHKVVDLACGSGTLLSAVLTDMKRRAKERGADEGRLAELQKIAVEETIKGLEINSVSLQLAASQLTAGNREIRYSQMGLHLMPYGPQREASGWVAAGTLELLGQESIVPRPGELPHADPEIASGAVRVNADDVELENAVSAARDARIVVMNPPFTNRAKMAQKFPKSDQEAMRNWIDKLQEWVVGCDPEMARFVDKNSLAPLFVALADRVVRTSDGALAMIHPTIAWTNTSGQEERIVLARRFYIHTILTCHVPGQINLSQNTSINESVTIAVRHDGVRPPTRIINLDRMPKDEAEVADLHRCLVECPRGTMAHGWGEVSEWPTHRIEAGDWSATIWRSPELAEAAARLADDETLPRLKALRMTPFATGQELRSKFEATSAGTPGSIPILKSKGADGQTRIRSTPDEHWIPKKRSERERRMNGGTYRATERMREKAGYLLITAGQDTRTGRLTATANGTKYVGNSWMPVSGTTEAQAKALAVFLNSTLGRLQIMRNPGRKLEFPVYAAAEAANLRVPDVRDESIRCVLADAWERTRDCVVPQYRDGECDVRRIWDDAVAEALCWDPRELARLRCLLHREPHVRGLGYGQFAEDRSDHVGE